MLMKIGRVAEQSGVSIDTLRYYEQLGLLPIPQRSLSGYRLYTPRIVDRVAFIKRAQKFGFTLGEIGQMLQLEAADSHTCAQILKMIEHKLEDLDHRYKEIKRLRRELSVYKTECEQAVEIDQPCPVIEDFTQHS